MANQVLTKWVKTAYPYLKEGCGLPPWVLAEHSVNRAIDEVGDTGLLKVSKPLDMADTVNWLFETESDSASISPTEWQDAIKRHKSFDNLKPVVSAFIEVADIITAQFPLLKSNIDPMIICRSLAVLLYAPLVDKGKDILADVAGELGVQTNQPADLRLSYAEAVVRGDIETLEKVYNYISKYSDWQEWASALQEEVVKCKFRPKLIAVTPPLSGELAGVLATMVKEAHHDESGGYHPGDSVDEVLAQ